MKLFSTTLMAIGLLWATNGASYAQSADIDSVKRRLIDQPNDTTRVRLLNRLAFLYYNNKPDTTYHLAQQAYHLARRLADKPGQALSLNRMGVALGNLGDYPKALRLYQQSLKISRSTGDLRTTARTLNNTALVYGDQKNHQRALSLYLASLVAIRQASQQSSSYDTLGFITSYSNLSETYWHLNRLDSADYYSQQALQLARQSKDEIGLYSVLDVLGHIQEKRGNNRAALIYYRQSLGIARQIGELVGQADVYLSIAGLYQKIGSLDSARVNARKALTSSQQSSYLSGALKASQLLTQLYEGRDNAQALAYYKVMVAAKDSLFSQEKVKQFLTLDFEEQQRQQEIEAAKTDYQNSIYTYGLSALVVVSLLVALLLLRTTQRQERSNQLLSQQKEEIDQQRSTAQQALAGLQAAQGQLIHQEKMASLGELTAGIAHEIQNPLNFVNNFAEVSTELVEELREGPLQHLSEANKAYVYEILDDLTQNLQKVVHHGKRADTIVRGMLAHSRIATGTRQPTNLNALAEEYLKLSYHGLRAKDKDFNAELTTDFDPVIGKVDVIPQDLGRVLLNLYNNAFYAVRQKQQQLSPVPVGTQEPESGPVDYHPQLTIRTRRLKGHIEIEVRDNGTGMPEMVKQKIFQPFFTTKPTGEGTGLGLSLSYDIVTKGHGGSMNVDSELGAYTIITILLPI